MRNRALKYATAALIIVMVLSLCSSCALKLLKDPYDIYKFIYNYTRNEKNYAADIVIDINYNETVSEKKRSCYLGIKGTLKVTDVGSEDMMMESHQKNVINFLGYKQTTDLDVFLTKDRVYEKTSDMKFYRSYSRSSKEGQSIEKTAFYPLNIEYDKSAFFSDSATVNEDGSRTVRASLSEDDFQTVWKDVKKMLDNISDDGTYTYAKYSLDYYYVDYTLGADGRPLSEVVSARIIGKNSAVGPAYDAVYTISSSAVYTAFGDDVVITIP